MRWTVLLAMLLVVAILDGYRGWEWRSWRWFHLSSPMWIWWWPRWLPALPNGRKQATLRLWNLFNRVTADKQHWWGIGVLQLGRLHLIYIGDAGCRVLFLGTEGPEPTVARPGTPG
jgi:hypothetical protein